MENNYDFYNYNENENEFNWSNKKPTDDEIEVIKTLKKIKTKPKNILHIGIGSNYIHQNFPDINIVGVTVNQKEYENALLLNKANYKLILFNKYNPKFKSFFNETFDWIIDVNIGNFRCCHFHSLNYFKLLVKLLSNDGYIFTNIRGLLYVYKDNNPINLKMYSEQTNVKLFKDNNNVVIKK